MHDSHSFSPMFCLVGEILQVGLWYVCIGKLINDENASSWAKTFAGQYIYSAVDCLIGNSVSVCIKLRFINKS